VVPAADGRGSFEPPRALCIPDGRVSAFRTQWSETNCRHYDAIADPAGEHEDHDARDAASSRVDTHMRVHRNAHNSASTRRNSRFRFWIFARRFSICIFVQFLAHIFLRKTFSTEQIARHFTFNKMRKFHICSI